MKRLVVLALLLVPVLPASAAVRPIVASQDAWPLYSPSGRWLAFTRIQGYTMSLEVLDTSTSRLRMIARNAYQLQPSWEPQPSGDRIAYQAYGHVYVSQADGSARREIAAGLAPAWRPRGAQIAYLRGTDLYVGGARWATRVIGHAAWSPDGTTIAFQRDDGIYTTDGTREAQLASASNPGNPAWSPDGSSIAYTAGNRMWFVAVDGHAQPPQVASPILANLGVPSWSRGSDAVVFSRRGGVQESSVGGTSSLLLAVSEGLGASFSPVADTVAVAAPRDGCPGHIGIGAYNGRSVRSLTGTCELRGTGRADVIEGTFREGDVILAGAGNDLIHVNDGHTDAVDCGAGRDTVWADQADRLRGCEIVHR